jgi:hypothetical protein
MRTGTCVDIEINAARWEDLMNVTGQLVTLLQPRHFLRR